MRGKVVYYFAKRGGFVQDELGAFYAFEPHHHNVELKRDQLVDFSACFVSDARWCTEIRLARCKCLKRAVTFAKTNLTKPAFEGSADVFDVVIPYEPAACIDCQP